MKGLLLSLMALAVQAAESSVTDINEEVTRKIVLDQFSVLEIISDIRFKSASSQTSTNYYFTVPRNLDYNLVNLKAEDAITGDEFDIIRLDTIPASVLSLYTKKNASDVIFFRITLKLSKGSAAFVVKELYKRRKTPFPSVISIRENEEQLIKFVDSKYLLSLYPTKSQRLVINYDTNAFLYIECLS